MDFRQIDKNLQVEFARKKVNAEKVASSNIMKANSIPAFAKLSSLERKVSFELSKLKITDKDYKVLKTNLTDIREAKIKLLDRLNLKPEDLKPKYECERCLDSGIVNGNVCSCYKKRKNEELIKVFGLEISKDNTFEKFSTKICSDKKQAEDLEKMKNLLEKWSNEFPNVKRTNIVISGETGVGKTYLADCLANSFLSKNCSVCYVSAFSMNEAFLKYHTSFDYNKSAWLDPFLESDLLIIDDLGTEPLFKNVTSNYLYLVLSERERFGRPVVITTNLKASNILDRYFERVYSRIVNKKTSVFLHLSGKDLRVSK